jgi:hypothetical protein
MNHTRAYRATCGEPACTCVSELAFLSVFFFNLVREVWGVSLCVCVCSTNVCARSGQDARGMQVLPARPSTLAFGVWQRTVHERARHRGIPEVVVNFGANDGVAMQDPVAFWLTTPAARGLAVEVAADHAPALRRHYPSPDVAIRAGGDGVTPHNAARLLQSANTPIDPLVLKVDLDSYDADVVDAVLRAGFRPHVLVLEVNEKLPPGLGFAVRYAPGRRWTWAFDHTYGSSLSAWAAVLRPYAEYTLVGQSFNQLLYARPSMLAGAVTGANTSLPCAYEEGYLRRTDKPKYNQDVAAWLNESRPARARLSDVKSYVATSRTRRLVGDAYPVDVWIEDDPLPIVRGSCDALRRSGARRVRWHEAAPPSTPP